MKKVIFIILLVSTSLSCSNFFSKNSINFQITNNTSYTINSLEVKLNPETEIMSSSYIIQPGGSESIVLDMSRAKLEGSFCISYLIGGRYIEENTGYYTNGCPSEEEMNCVVTTDGLIKW